MSRLTEYYHQYNDMNANMFADLVEKIIKKGVLSGEIESGQYVVIDDDGIYVGDDKDFDADVLYYAVPVDDIVDFSKVGDDDDFVDVSSVNFDHLITNVY